MAANPLLRIRGLTCSFGGLLAVSDLDLDLWPGNLAGLIGPNGAGKTTCFNLITGRVRPSGGSIELDGCAMGKLKPSKINHLGIARTFQNIRLYNDLTVLENVMVGFHGHLGHNFLSAVFNPFYYRVERDLKRRGRKLLELVGLSGMGNERASSLAYGQQRLLEIARALATRPRLVLLDEPAAGMNPQETVALAGLVRRLQKELDLTILLIEHDMRFVMNLCERLTVLDHGRTIATGPPAQVRSHPGVIKAYLGEDFDI